jgi:hypothetical protein
VAGQLHRLPADDTKTIQLGVCRIHAETALLSSGGPGQGTSEDGCKTAGSQPYGDEADACPG